MRKATVKALVRGRGAGEFSRLTEGGGIPMSGRKKIRNRKNIASHKRRHSVFSEIISSAFKEMFRTDKTFETFFTDTFYPIDQL